MTRKTSKEVVNAVKGITNARARDRGAVELAQRLKIDASKFKTNIALRKELGRRGWFWFPGRWAWDALKGDPER